MEYLLDKSEQESLHLTIADANLKNAQLKTRNHPNATAISLDISNIEKRKKEIQKASIVISMLPASLHVEVAKDCLEFGKNLVTASYVSKEMESLHEDAVKNGLTFMNEIGVDPGIDHMSAMKTINKIRDQGGTLLRFESFTGGLIAPENDDNLWNYKFTWNPRNVVVAGQGGVAKFIQEGKYKYIPYQKLFRRTKFLNIDGYGKFEAYANRDSLKYRSEYGLNKIPTLYRGTIRRIGFSKAWNVFVQLGMTDDSYSIGNSEKMTYREFTNSFLAYHPTDSVELKLRHYLKIDQDDIIWSKLMELNLFDDTKTIQLKNATPAQILQKILTDSWTLNPDDKDMIVMHHKFGYELDGKKEQIESQMVLLGKDQIYTAMAQTVGLPVAIATLLILNKKITSKGVLIPIKKEIYMPILNELENYGILFKEKKSPLF